MDPELVAERALYHGLAGLLTGPGIADWPERLRSRLRQQALAQVMWELRHKIVLTELLNALAAAGIKVVVLKGTALAYRYYSNPAARARGDSDLLIAPEALAKARHVLREQGFTPFFEADADPSLRLQEPWSLSLPEGSKHEIDLHWSALNTPALDRLIPVETALSQAHALPALGPAAWMLPPHLALLHTCLHRAMHVTSPYFVDGAMHYGGDRLIWLKDIDVMLRALEASDVVAFEVVAKEAQVGPICAQALQTAHDLLATPLAEDATDRLHRMPVGVAGRYLTHTHQARRAMEDFNAVQGFGGKLQYLWNRLFPPADFMRAKYPGLAHRPLALLYLRRSLEFWRPRPRNIR